MIPALVRYEVLPPVRRFTLPGLACLVREKRESANMLTPVMGVAASETGKAAICPILPSLILFFPSSREIFCELASFFLCFGTRPVLLIHPEGVPHKPMPFHSFPVTCQPLIRN